MVKLKVSVLLPVYNGEKYLREAIDSILTQSYEKLELLIINDGSNDGTEEIIKSYKDSRICYLKNKKNCGLTKTLNRGLKTARGEYIVRMDADDVSLPKRLETQVRFMEDNENVGISGTWFKTTGDKPGIIKKYPSDPRTIKCELLFGQELAHPTVIMRTSVLRKFNLKYDERYKDAEDYDLFVRAAKITQLANIPKVLFLYRRHASQKGFEDQGRMNKFISLVHKKQLKRLGIRTSSKDLEIFLDLSRNRFRGSLDFIYHATLLYVRIITANLKKNYYPRILLSKIIAKRWLFALKQF